MQSRQRPPLARVHWTTCSAHQTTDALRIKQSAQHADRASGDGRHLCTGTTAAAIRQFVFLQDDKTVPCTAAAWGRASSLRSPTDDDLRRYSGSANGPVPTLRRQRHTAERRRLVSNLTAVASTPTASKNGTAANDSNYTAADCFFDAPLAAAQRDGKWVYLDTAGPRGNRTLL